MVIYSDEPHWSCEIFLDNSVIKDAKKHFGKVGPKALGE